MAFFGATTRKSIAKENQKALPVWTVLYVQRHAKNGGKIKKRCRLDKAFLQLRTENRIRNIWNEMKFISNAELQVSSSSPRSISITQLNTLLCLHPWPIKLVVYKWPYHLKGVGYLILRCISRLDAFSVYYIHTRLFGYALGRTTDAPEVRPTRSSRTKVSSSQISNAHDR